MIKTVTICDCCGMEVDKLFRCFKQVRDWRGYKNIPDTWEICQNCINMLEGAMSREIDSIHGKGMSAQKCIRRIEGALIRETSYRVCDRNGWSKYDSLEHLDAYLKRIMADGIAFWPIKRIVKVTSEDIPFTETARRYNDWVVATKKKEGDAK